MSRRVPLWVKRINAFFSGPAWEPDEWPTVPRRIYAATLPISWPLWHAAVAVSLLVWLALLTLLALPCAVYDRARELWG